MSAQKRVVMCQQDAIKLKIVQPSRFHHLLGSIKILLQFYKSESFLGGIQTGNLQRNAQEPFKIGTGLF